MENKNENNENSQRKLIELIASSTSPVELDDVAHLDERQIREIAHHGSIFNNEKTDQQKELLLMLTDKSHFLLHMVDNIQEERRFFDWMTNLKLPSAEKQYTKKYSENSALIVDSELYKILFDLMNVYPDDPAACLSAVKQIFEDATGTGNTFLLYWFYLLSLREKLIDCIIQTFISSMGKSCLIKPDNACFDNAWFNKRYPKIEDKILRIHIIFPDSYLKTLIPLFPTNMPWFFETVDENPNLPAKQHYRGLLEEISKNIKP
jgi:hypothetical protein